MKHKYVNLNMQCGTFLLWKKNNLYHPLSLLWNTYRHIVPGFKMQDIHLCEKNPTLQVLENCYA